MAGSSVQETEETSLAGTQPRDLRLSAPFQVPIRHAAENAATTIGNPRTHGKGRQPDLETDLATLDRPPAASMGGNNFVTMRGPVMAMALSARPVVSLTPFASMRPVVDIDRLASVRGAALAFHHAPAYDSMRGAVLVLDDAPLSPTSALHPSTSETSAMPTSSDAGAILRHLGLSEVKVQAVLGRSVKQVVGLVLRNQGVRVQASQWEGVEGVVAECGTRVLKTLEASIMKPVVSDVLNRESWPGGAAEARGDPPDLRRASRGFTAPPGTMGSVALHANLGTLSQVMDGLRRLPHGIAQELQEQRRQAVRSLGV
ncbi:hypothetical protein T484DRAFT_2025837, partial [Baffinella frigidus]